MDTNKHQNTMNNKNAVYQAILCKKTIFIQTKIMFVATNFLELFGIYNKVAWRSYTLKGFKCSATKEIIFLKYFNSFFKSPKKPSRGIKHAL